jgi:sugar/nucleoside kinase (ribokinase family)
VLLLGAPDAVGPIGGDGLGAVADAGRAGGATIVIDMLRRGSPADFGRLGALIGAADWFCPNDDQLRGLTGRAEIADAIGDVLALGTRGVAVTLGADGCLVTGGDGGLLRLPAPQVDVVDTTGCGDGFDAGMIAGLLLGCGPADAARLATACGSLVATGLGSDAGITSATMQSSSCAAPSPTRRRASRRGERHGHGRSSVHWASRSASAGN